VCVIATEYETDNCVRHLIQGTKT